jgi:SNF2 family DNA or RNA helicase
VRFSGIQIYGDSFAELEIKMAGNYLEARLNKLSNNLAPTFTIERACDDGLQDLLESNPTTDRLKNALEWMLDSDSVAMRQFRSGELITKRIPVTHPVSPRFSSPIGSVDGYLSARQTTGALIRPILLPEPPLEHLYPFQRDGTEWLLTHKRALIADDMGLGKTIQSISAMRILFNRGFIRNALIVCPPSLINNWESEILRWAPELSFVRLSPPAKIKDSAWESILGRTHIVLTNYEQMRLLPAALNRNVVHLVICDEIHRIRNVRAKASAGMQSLKSDRFWALSGTPLERDKEDLITLLALLDPQIYSAADKNMHVASLRAQLNKYTLRRLKSEVLQDLPDVVDTTEELELSPKQRTAYNQVLRDIKKSKENQVLANVNRLRTICDYEEESNESAKADRIVEIVEKIKNIHEKAVVFSFLIKPMDLLSDRLKEVIGPRAIETVRGDMDLNDRNQALVRFRQDADKTVLLCSSRVGSEGLNLTEANHVIFFNEWWNPAANNQARDRVIRIGQDRKVWVYRFRCSGTIDQAFDDIIKRKNLDTEQMVDVFATQANQTPLDIEDVLSELKEL